MSDHVCPWWLCFTFDNPLRRLIHNPDGILAGLVLPGQTALDVGCGMGYFTLALARAVGPNGHVIAADLQPKMLAQAGLRAQRAGLADRIRFHQCRPNRIDLDEPVDFALAFWMVHETPNPASFLDEIHALLKPAGQLLIVEPILHVPEARFVEVVEAARAAGLRPAAEVKVRLSRARLFTL